MRLIGIADSQAASVVSGLIQDAGSEVCVCDGCDFVETQFVKNGGETWQNDYKSFIKMKALDTDTITFTLYKDGVLKATLNSTSYGTYYNFGDLAIGNVKGFIVDWNLVQLAFGYGFYTVRTTQVSAGQTYTWDSHKFHVIEYVPERADGTVKIETYQNGSILSGFDYTGIGWPQSLRIDGKFGNKTPTYVTDNFIDTRRKVHQITAEIENVYTLETHLLPGYISDYLNEDAMLSNIILITDYNLLNQKIYRKFPVYLSEIKDVNNQVLSTKSNYVYEFKEVDKNNLKRNVYGDIGALPIPSSSLTKFIEIKTFVVIFEFLEDELEATVTDVQADGVGTIESVTQDGASGTITWSVNGGAFGAAPSEYQLGDTIVVKRTVSTAAGFVKTTGLYV